MKTTVVAFGDEGKIRIPISPINCSAVGYFDYLEEDCLELIDKYLDFFGIHHVKNEDGEVARNYELAKRIQDVIVEELAFSGVKFTFEEQKNDNI